MIGAVPGMLATSERLGLREFSLADADWILPLLNDADFLANIGDKGVRTLADAERYLSDGPMASYRANGFGLWAATRRSDGEPVGMAGILRRPTLPEPDLGYAIRPAMRGHGYGLEAAGLALGHGHRELGFPRILAIVTPSNTGSREILERLGFRHESMHLPPGGGEPVELHAHLV